MNLRQFFLSSKIVSHFKKVLRSLYFMRKIIDFVVKLWYDVFSLNEKAALCTGYRNMPGKEIPTNITSYYNKRAEEIFHNPILSYEEKNKNLSELIDQLVDELEEI